MCGSSRLPTVSRADSPHPAPEASVLSRRILHNFHSLVRDELPRVLFLSMVIFLVSRHMVLDLALISFTSFLGHVSFHLWDARVTAAQNHGRDKRGNKQKKNSIASNHDVDLQEATAVDLIPVHFTCVGHLLVPLCVSSPVGSLKFVSRGCRASF